MAGFVFLGVCAMLLSLFNEFAAFAPSPYMAPSTTQASGTDSLVLVSAQ